jgi:hypothetical protein
MTMQRAFNRRVRRVSDEIAKKNNGEMEEDEKLLGSILCGLGFLRSLGEFSLRSLRLKYFIEFALRSHNGSRHVSTIVPCRRDE